MASELDSHYAVARRVAFQVEEQLQELETGRDTSLTFQGNISTNLNQLARELETLEALLATEQDGARRGAWRKCALFPRRFIMRVRSGSRVSWMPGPCVALCAQEAKAAP